MAVLSFTVVTADSDALTLASLSASKGSTPSSASLEYSFP